MSIATTLSFIVNINVSSAKTPNIFTDPDTVFILCLISNTNDIDNNNVSFCEKY